MAAAPGTLLLQMQVFHGKEDHCVATHNTPGSVIKDLLPPSRTLSIPENSAPGQKRCRAREEAHWRVPGLPETAQLLNICGAPQRLWAQGAGWRGPAGRKAGDRTDPVRPGS